MNPNGEPFPAAHRALPPRLLRRDASIRQNPSRGPVLLVDDESINLMIYQAVLHRVFRARVMTATNGDDALRRAAALRPSLVISDVNHTGLDGLELTRELLRLHPRLPIILISGAMTVAIESEAITAGAIACLAKPFDYADFLRVIRRVWRRR